MKCINMWQMVVDSGPWLAPAIINHRKLTTLSFYFKISMWCHEAHEPVENVCITRQQLQTIPVSSMVNTCAINLSINRAVYLENLVSPIVVTNNRIALHRRFKWFRFKVSDLIPLFYGRSSWKKKKKKIL